MASELRRFQDQLKSLYIEQDLKLEQVREFMKREHSVNVGRSSYERLFKEWGLRKTKKGEDWRWVSHRIQKRQKNGRKSVLHINNTKIPEELVQEEISRHVSTRQQAIDRAVMASPKTPAGYLIATPGSSSEVAATPGRMNSPFTPEPSSECLDVVVLTSSGNTFSDDTAPWLSCHGDELTMETSQDYGDFAEFACLSLSRPEANELFDSTVEDLNDPMFDPFSDEYLESVNQDVLSIIKTAIRHLVGQFALVKDSSIIKGFLISAFQKCHGNDERIFIYWSLVKFAGQPPGFKDNRSPSSPVPCASQWGKFKDIRYPSSPARFAFLEDGRYPLPPANHPNFSVLRSWDD